MHVSGPTKVTVSLRELDSGKLVATADADAAASDWTKYTVKLDIKTGDVRRLEPLRFAVSVEGIEPVDVDQISLMPDDAIGS
jgi:alpha-L-arabinofuranosidase